MQQIIKKFKIKLQQLLCKAVIRKDETVEIGHSRFCWKLMIFVKTFGNDQKVATWQRIDDNLVAMTKSRLDAILTEIKINEDWSKEIIDEASIGDLDSEAIKKQKLNL